MMVELTGVQVFLGIGAIVLGPGGAVWFAVRGIQSELHDMKTALSGVHNTLRLFEVADAKGEARLSHIEQIVVNKEKVAQLESELSKLEKRIEKNTERIEAQGKRP
jgi:glutamate synthase domain-containing protein 1